MSAFPSSLPGREGQMPVEILPCPWCGCAGEVRQMPDIARLWFVECDSWKDREGQGRGRGRCFGLRERAIEAWNAVAALRARTEALTAALRHAKDRDHKHARWCDGCTAIDAALEAQ